MKKAKYTIKQQLGIGGLGLLLIILLLWMNSRRIKIVDKTDLLMRSSTTTYKTRSLEQIKQIVVHHSASIGKRAEDHARYHVQSRGWPAIGYHFVIEANGMIVLCNPINLISYGVENNNTPSIHICLSGDFTQQQPSTEQLKSLKQLITHLRKQVPQYLSVTGHKDYKATSCPGSNLYQHLYQFNAA